MKTVSTNMLIRSCGCSIDFTKGGRILRIALCASCYPWVDIQAPLELPLACSDNADDPDPEAHHAQ